jgi:hypothetical protein
MDSTLKYEIIGKYIYTFGGMHYRFIVFVERCNDALTQIKEIETLIAAPTAG